MLWLAPESQKPVCITEFGSLTFVWCKTISCTWRSCEYETLTYPSFSFLMTFSFFFSPLLFLSVPIQRISWAVQFFQFFPWEKEKLWGVRSWCHLHQQWTPQKQQNFKYSACTPCISKALEQSPSLSWWQASLLAFKAKRIYFLCRVSSGTRSSGRKRVWVATFERPVW